MNKFVVLEGKRLLPLMFLVVLLVTLSVYDNFFRMQEEETIPAVEEEFVFHTTTKGEISAPTSFHLIHNQSQWEELKENPLIELPDYPFNDEYEMAVCSVNSEIEDMDIRAEEDNVQKVEVHVKMNPNYYHIVMVSRDKLNSEEIYWTFLDESGEVLLQESVEQERMVIEELGQVIK